MKNFPLPGSLRRHLKRPAFARRDPQSDGVQIPGAVPPEAFGALSLCTSAESFQKISLSAI